MDLFQKMKLMEDNYTNAEAKVYHTIVENPRVVDLYPITGIAAQADTSTSAVQRFCQTLGYRGYKDFRVEMVQYLRKQSEASPAASDPIRQISDILSNAMNELRDMDRQQLDMLAEDLLSANAIYTLGVYRSGLPAKKLQYNLEDLGMVVLSADDPIAFGHRAFSMTENSAVVIFSASGHPFHYQNIFTSITNRAPHIWLVTCNPNAKMRKMISNTIVLPTVGYDKNYPLDEHPVMMAFVELISYLVRQKRPNERA